MSSNIQEILAALSSVQDADGENLIGHADFVLDQGSELASINGNDLGTVGNAALREAEQILITLKKRLVPVLLDHAQTNSDRLQSSPGHADASKWNGAIQRALILLDQMGGLSQAQSLQVATLRGDAVSMSAALDATAQFNSNKARWERMLIEADLLFPANPDSAYSDARRAYEEIQKERVRPGRTAEQDSQLLKLFSLARQRYDDYRARHYISTSYETALQGDPTPIAHFRELVNSYPKGHPNRIVTYFESAAQNAATAPMDAEDAINRCQNRLINLYWRPESEKALSDADDALRRHDPEGAHAALNRIDALQFRDDASHGAVFPDSFLRRQKAKRAELVPERKQYGEATHLLQDARRILVEDGDPVQAEAKRLEAFSAFKWHEGIEPLRGMVLKAAHEALPSTLQWLADAISQRSHWVRVSKLAKDAEDLIRLDRDLKSEFSLVLERWSAIIQLIGLYLKSPQFGPDRREAISNLQRFGGEYWDTEGWAGLRHELKELEAARDVEAVIERARQVCSQDSQPAVIEQSLTNVKRLLESAPEASSSTQIGVMRTLSAQLDAWLGYAMARDALTRAGGGMGVDLNEVAVSLERASERTGGVPAVLLRPLTTKLKQLQRNDDAAATALAELQAEALAEELSLLQKALDRCQDFSGRPTSFRVEFSDLEREIAGSLVEKLGQKLHRMLSATQLGSFQTLDVAEASEILERIEKLAHTPPVWLKGAQAALAVARVWRLETEAGNSQRRWSEVNAAWNTAAELYKPGDPIRKECLARASKAFLKKTLLQARGTDKYEVAAAALQPLVSGGEYEDELELWEAYGNVSVLATQEIGLTQFDTAGTYKMGQHIVAARSARDRVHELSSSIVTGADPADRLSAWNSVVQLRRKIHHLLGKPDCRVSARDCSEAVREVASTRSAAREGTMVLPALDAFWSSVSQITSDCLDSRLQSAARQTDDDEALVRVDILLGLAVLHPGDPMYVNRVLSPMRDEDARLRRSAEELYDDVEAQRFLIRSPEAALSPLEIAAKQRLEASWLRQRVDDHFESARTVSLLLSRHVTNGESGLPDESALRRSQSRLDQWIQSLSNFENALAIARTRAREGVRDPKKYRTALYILRSGGSDGDNSPQVEQQFNDRSHPSLLAMRRYVEQLRDLCQAQSKERRFVEYASALSNATTEQELGLEPQNEPERGWHHELRTRLVDRVRAVYPIEIALEHITRMRKDAPDDGCNEQTEVAFYDTVGVAGEVKGLEDLEAVLEPRANQFLCAMKWYAGVSGSGVPSADFPGTVDWVNKRKVLEELRDSSPDGMGRAIVVARQLLRDDFVGGKWSLKKQVHELANDSLARFLAANKCPPPLVGPATKVELRRVEAHTKVLRQVRECDEFLKDAEARFDAINTAWDIFKDAYEAAMSWRPPLIGGHRLLAQTEDWTELKRVARIYASLCPNDPRFTDFLNILVGAKGLSPLEKGGSA